MFFSMNGPFIPKNIPFSLKILTFIVKKYIFTISNNGIKKGEEINMENQVNMENQTQKSKKPMVLGIVSLVAWTIPIIGLIVGTFGIVISLKKLKEDKCKAYKIGLSLNIIGIILSILCWIFTTYLIMKNNII